MKKLLNKELRLAASPLSYFFILAAFLTFVPGYPILLGAFFVTLGIFYSFQTVRENNDIGYSLLLPVSKADTVKGKYTFILFIEFLSFILTAIITALRMTVLKNAIPYTQNALMSANLTFLGFVLIIFGLFNFAFVSGFFKTAYFFGKPFIFYCVYSLLTITLAESLHHIPGLEALNSLGFEVMLPQTAVFCVGALLFAVLTLSGVKISVKRFNNTDL